MDKLQAVMNKNERLVIGLMSGTSVDGIDAAIVRIKGSYKNTCVQLLGFRNFAYPSGVRERIFRLFEDETSSSREICHMNFLLGELFAQAAQCICSCLGIAMEEVDLIGSHGQTIYHIPQLSNDCGYEIRSTLQIGEGAVIAHRTGVITISDFRVADVAAGGQGAPLVPYTEYLMYCRPDRTVALQNIGGVGNITVLPAGCGEDEVIAFDTGPGNMLIDAVVAHITNRRQQYDESGGIAASGQVCGNLLSILMEDVFFRTAPPKTTGREYFGKEYARKFMEQCKQLGLSDEDIVATATALTAKSIAQGCKSYVPNKIDQMIIGGGGSYNTTLVNMIREYMNGTQVLVQEDLGLNSDAKEAVAFAVLANEAINRNTNNLPSATGAVQKKILGKISL